MNESRPTLNLPGAPVRTLPDIPPFSAARLRQLGLIGLHCGSGATLLAGCVNTDQIRLIDQSGSATQRGRLAVIGDERYYLEQDLSLLLPFGDGVFDWAFAEHFIEHLDVPEAIAWLSEVGRVLKSGGVLRISTPDLRRYASAYVDDVDGFFPRHKRHLEAMGINAVPVRPAWMLNQIFGHWGHRWIYDMDELRLVAQAAGFAPDHIAERAFRQGGIRELCALDQEIRSDESLYAEITMK